jgi:hypothetical protein
MPQFAMDGCWRLAWPGEGQTLRRVPKRLPPLVLVLVIVSLTASPAAQAAEPLVPAQSARSFGDSVGVNTHVGWSDTPAYANFDPVLARLRELGVRNVRDGICPTCVEWISRLRRLGAAGIKVNLVAGNLTDSTAKLQENLNAMRDKLPGAVRSIEAPNEPDQTGNPLWASIEQVFQRELSTRVNADSKLRALPVLGPALVYPASWSALGDLTPYLDRGNMHPYPGGGTPLHNIADLLPLAHIVSGSKPIVATEAGYHSDLATTSGHYGTSERAIGIYMPRLALEGFRNGLERTYIYQLADPWTNVSGFENKFGLLRNDLSPKPAFLALRNLMRAVDAGSAPVSDPGGVRFSLKGAQPDVRRLLLRSANGSYALVLWREVSVWDRVGKHDLSPAPEWVTVDLGEPMAQAQLFKPVESPNVAQSVDSPDQIPVALDGSPIVLRLVPAGPRRSGETKARKRKGSTPTACASRLGGRLGCCAKSARHKGKHRHAKRAGRRNRAIWRPLTHRTRPTSCAKKRGR